MSRRYRIPDSTLSLHATDKSEQEVLSTDVIDFSEGQQRSKRCPAGMNDGLEVRIIKVRGRHRDAIDEN